MTNPVTYASAQQFTGVAKEITQGTPVPMTATIPTDKFDPVDVPKMLDDTASRGSNVEVYDQILGVGHSECSLSGPVYADTLGWLLAGILGDVATVGASAPYTHTIAVLNGGATNGQPTSYTFTDFTGIGTHGGRAWPGQIVESVTLKWNADGLFTYDAKTQGWLSSLLAATPAAAASTVETVPAWKFAPTLAAAPVANMTTGEITLTRKVKAYFGSGATQNPYFIRAGKVGVGFKFTEVAADETAITKFLANTIEAFVGTLDNGLAAAAHASVAWQFSKAAYKVAKRDYSNEAIEFSVEGQAIANTTDAGASAGYSPVKFTVINALPTGTYV